MVFNSFTFGVFFALVWLAYMGLQGRWGSQKALLVVASYLFYGAWNPPVVVLLWVSTVVDWLAARWMTSAATDRVRRLALLLSLISNLGMLATFKYGGFLLENLQALLRLGNMEYTPPGWELVLPVGISFYTFQTLSYTIDVYRGRIDGRETGFLDFSLFVAFFPQLVAGPIVRAVDFLPQLRVPRVVGRSAVTWGVVLLSFGLFEKTVLADAVFARSADAAFSVPEKLGGFDSWVGALAFSGQIFCDFAGYSTAAIGVAMCFGFALPDNFQSPYGAIGFSEFWQRWHISLSSWLRDYLYISLGGNRRGTWNTYRNLMLTMLLGGLWHGASWNFVLWGGLHGGYLVAERLWRRGAPIPASFFARLLGWALTQLAVLMAWIPFRAETLPDTLTFFRALLVPGRLFGHVLTLSNGALTLAVATTLYGLHYASRSRRLEDTLGRLGPLSLGSVVAVLWLLIWLAHPEDRSFIYFQF